MWSAITGLQAASVQEEDLGDLVTGSLYTFSLLLFANHQGGMVGLVVKVGQEVL